MVHSLIIEILSLSLHLFPQCGLVLLLVLAVIVVVVFRHLLAALHLEGQKATEGER